MGVVFIAERSNTEHRRPLTLHGKPMPYLHRNARSRYITHDEVMDVYWEDVNTPVSTAVEGPYGW